MGLLKKERKKKKILRNNAIRSRVRFYALPRITGVILRAVPLPNRVRVFLPVALSLQFPPDTRARADEPERSAAHRARSLFSLLQHWEPLLGLHSILHLVIHICLLALAPSSSPSILSSLPLSLSFSFFLFSSPHPRPVSNDRVEKRR